MFYFNPEVRTATDEPGMCAYGHVGIPGRLVSRWHHCDCAAVPPGWPGHWVWLCQDCRDAGRDDEAWLYPAGHRKGDGNVRDRVNGRI